MAPPLLVNNKCPAAELVTPPWFWKRGGRPQRGAVWVLKHPTEAAHMSHRIDGKLFFAVARLGMKPQACPSAAWRMGNHWRSSRPLACIALGIPYIAARQRLVMAVGAGKKYGYCHWLSFSLRVHVTPNRALKRTPKGAA